MDLINATKGMILKAQGFSFNISPPPGIPTDTSDLVNTISVVITSAYSVAGVACVGWLIYGGYKWIVSTGDPQKLTEAQKTLLNAVIGMVIIISSGVLFNFVADKLGVGSIITILDLPTM